MNDEHAAAILALLEDGAHSELELAEWLEQPPDVVRDVLTQLHTANLVRRIRGAADSDAHWRLGRTVPVIEPVGLRQPHERPARSTVTADARGSWWVDVPADGFTNLAETHQTRMHNSRMARFVHGNVSGDK